MSDERLFIGGNNPPPDLKVGEELRERLRDDHRTLAARRDELLAEADDFDAGHPSINDDETSGIAAGIIVQMTRSAKAIDATREAEKAPYLEGGRIVDGFFGPMKQALVNRASEINRKQTAYQRAKAERARREAEEAAAKARAEEEARRREAERLERERARAEREARKAREDQAASEEALRRAQEAERRAEEARRAEERARAERQQAARTAASSAADRSRVRGGYAVSSLRTDWKFEVLDISKVPAEFLQVNAALVNAAIRGENGRRDIPGLRIYPVETAQQR